MDLWTYKQHFLSNLTQILMRVILKITYGKFEKDLRNAKFPVDINTVRGKTAHKAESTTHYMLRS